MSDKPHLVLNWIFDVPNYKLYIKLAEDLEYESHEGGCEGYTKTFRGEKTHITPLQWEQTEKHWISENYGHIYGYFQPDFKRTKKHPQWGWDQVCVNGLGPDGEYLDHMQRMQILLEGNDMAEIFGSDSGDRYYTPDCGKTVYKRVATRDVNYPEEMMKVPGAVWPEWPQACLMQPRTKGPRLSNYEELLAAGASQDIIDKCAAGEWPAPKNPELQKYYIYPTV